jgi:signal transduction histidine kinase
VSPVEKGSISTEAVVERILANSRSLLLARLTAPAAHEIINPASAAVNLGALMKHILKEDGIPSDRVPEFREYLSQVIGESTRAGRIASDLLSFARSLSREPHAVDVNEMVRQACALATHLFKEADIQSQHVLAERLPIIRGNGTRIQEALLHLLVNAVDAVGESRDRRVAIETRLQEDGLSVVLEIRDSGEGIAPEHLPRIFDPFFTTRENRQSLGMGLTIARSIVLAHKGSIEVDSRPGRSTAIRLTFPVGEE